MIKLMSILSLAIFAPICSVAQTHKRSDFQLQDVTARSKLVPGEMASVPAGTLLTRNIMATNNIGNQEVVSIIIKSRIQGSPADQWKPVLIKKLILEPYSHISVLIHIKTPAVAVNTAYHLLLSMYKTKELVAKDTDNLLLVPQGTEGSQAILDGTDEKIQGDWKGKYGKEAFSIPILNGNAYYAISSLSIKRGTGNFTIADTPLIQYAKDEIAFRIWDPKPVTDKRVLLGGNGLTTRDPVAFSAKPLVVPSSTGGQDSLVAIPLTFHITSTDGLPHLLSFYLLDYKSEGFKEQVTIYDNEGHKLTEYKSGPLDQGEYVSFRFTGNVVAVIKRIHAPMNSTDVPLCSGIFIDPSNGDGMLWQKAGEAEAAK